MSERYSVIDNLGRTHIITYSWDLAIAKAREAAKTFPPVRIYQGDYLLITLGRPK